MIASESVEYHPLQHPETTTNAGELLSHLQRCLKENLEYISGAKLRVENYGWKYYKKPVDPNENWELLKHLNNESGYRVYIQLEDGERVLYFDNIERTLEFLMSMVNKYRWPPIELDNPNLGTTSIKLKKYYPLKHPATRRDAVELLSHLQNGLKENLENIYGAMLVRNGSCACFLKPQDPTEDWELLSSLKNPLGYYVQIKVFGDKKYLCFHEMLKPNHVIYRLPFEIGHLDSICELNCGPIELGNQNHQSKCFNSMKYYPLKQPETTINAVSFLDHFKNGLKPNFENISGVFLLSKESFVFCKKPEDPTADWKILKCLDSQSGYDVHIKVRGIKQYLCFHEIPEPNPE